MKSSELSNGRNRIALRQLLQNRKWRHLWRHNLGSRWKLQKMARENFSIGAFYNITNKNSSGDEIANVNFYAVRPEATRIRWNNVKITPLRCSRSLKVTDFGANRKLVYDFLLVTNTNLPPILHSFRDIAVDRSEIVILAITWLPLFCLTPPTEGLGRSPWNFQWMSIDGYKVPNAVEILLKIWTAWVGRTNVTDDRQTHRRQTDDIRTGDSI